MQGMALIEIGVAVILALAVVGYMVGSLTWRRRAKMRRRMAAVDGLLSAEAGDDTPAPVAAAPQSPVSKNALAVRLDALYPLSGGVRTGLKAAAAALISFPSITFVLAFFGLSVVLAVIFAVALAGAIAWTVGGAVEDGKRHEFSERFLIVLEDFHRMVRYGISTNQALKSGAAAAEEPVKASLRNVVLQADVGVPVSIALEQEAGRVRISELSMLSAVISTQASTGGDMAESVANVAATLRERLGNRAKMKASTAESRITMIILSLVPFAAIGIQALFDGEFLGALLGPARHLLGIGLGLILVGLVVSWMIIKSAQR